MIIFRLWLTHVELRKMEAKIIQSNIKVIKCIFLNILFFYAFHNGLKLTIWGLKLPECWGTYKHTSSCLDHFDVFYNILEDYALWSWWCSRTAVFECHVEKLRWNEFSYRQTACLQLLDMPHWCPVPSSFLFWNSWSNVCILTLCNH